VRADGLTPVHAMYSHTQYTHVIGWTSARISTTSF